jgi:membrane-bound lytic murein transglycosylase MltF
VRVQSDVRLKENTLIAWMVRHESPRLRILLDEFLLEYKKSSAERDTLFARYYRNNPWIRNPLIRSKVEKLRDYRKIFVQNGEHYGFDWLVLMAAAFEFSGMDNTAKSPSGVGLMQVPPAAADGRDVSSPEANVKAAANRLAMLRDQYFSKPGIAPGDQLRFALAAYLVGPEKITRAREKAEKMGLDPNRWSGHVAIAAQETAGDEVVRSVGNIDKYALIYRLSEEINFPGTAKP